MAEDALQASDKRVRVLDAEVAQGDLCSIKLDTKTCPFLLDQVIEEKRRLVELVVNFLVRPGPATRDLIVRLALDRERSHVGTVCQCVLQDDILIVKFLVLLVLEHIELEVHQVRAAGDQLLDRGQC